MAGYARVGQGGAATVETKQQSKNLVLILKAKWVNIYCNTQCPKFPKRVLPPLQKHW